MYNLDEIIEIRYVVKNILMGGMGIVYVCFDNETEKFVALKTIQDGLALSMSGMERFLREASTWISIGRHPNIVFAENVQVFEGRPYIIMEYIPGDKKYGSSMRGRILQRNISTQLALEIMIQLCKGLTYAQKKVPGLVHRDLKPENILIASNDIIKISDFGLVNGLENDLEHMLPTDETLEFFQTNVTRSGRIVGTPPYMSPEQCLGQELDLRSDVYALGCIFFELLTYQWLLDSNDPREWITWHINNQPTKPSKVARNIPKRLDEIVISCLQKKPSERFENFVLLQQELTNVYREEFGERFSFQTQSVEDQRSEMDTVRSFLAIEDHYSALRILDPILQVDPKNMDAWVNKGHSLAALNKDDDALYALNIAYEMNPNSEKVLSNIGLVKLKAGSVDEAIEYFEKAIGIQPLIWQAWNNLGLAYEVKGEIGKAMDAFNESLRITPWQHPAWLNKSRILSNMGDRVQSNICAKNAFRYSISYKQRCDVVYLLLTDPEFQDEEFFDAGIKAIDNSIESQRDAILNRIKDTPLIGGYFVAGSENLPHGIEYWHLFGKIFVLSKKVGFLKSNNKNWGDLLAQILKSIDEWKEHHQYYMTEDILRGGLIGLYLLVYAEFLRIDDYITGEKIIKKAINIDPKDKLCGFMYGLCLFMTNNLEESLSYLVDTPKELLDLMDINDNEYESILSYIRHKSSKPFSGGETNG